MNHKLLMASSEDPYSRFDEDGAEFDDGYGYHTDLMADESTGGMSPLMAMRRRLGAGGGGAGRPMMMMPGQQQGVMGRPMPMRRSGIGGLFGGLGGSRLFRSRQGVMDRSGG